MRAVREASQSTSGGRLQGKTAIITAAADGIGRATAIAFAREGDLSCQRRIRIHIWDRRRDRWRLVKHLRSSAVIPEFRHRNLPDSLADHIVTLIATRQIAAGQRLFEKEMCERLGVSRVPVREALRILQAQGVVRTEPNRGTFVTEFGSREMLEMLEIRLVVEKVALRRLLLRAESEPQVFDAFEPHVEAMRQAALLSDRLAYSKADLAFHNCLIELSATPMLKPIWDCLSRDVFVFLMQERESGYDFNRSARDHERLLRVMRSGDAAEIEREIELHVQGTTRAKLPAARNAGSAGERRRPSPKAKRGSPR